MLRRTLAAVRAATLLAGAAACAHAQSVPSGAPVQVTTAKPTLVVFITIDQLRGDYFTRFGRQFTGGLHRFDVAGAHFTNAFQDHANTETAPGHASTMSGRFPVHTGIAANAAGVNDPASPLIGSTDPGASPFRFRGTTLLDWMRKRDGSTRFLSVSRKDRAAILPIGKVKGDVYWYASNGTFTQSTYYGVELPKWVKEFNAQQHPLDYAGWTWTPLLPDSAYAEPDSVPVESLGQQYMFPHEIADEPTLAAGTLPNFPVMDELTLRFALAGVKQLQLGTNPKRTDLLNISLSTTDAVGHRYGPDSKELHDQMLRVDRYLGAFVDSLFAIRDSTRIILTLTGDHGMSPFPTVLSTVTPNPGARVVDVTPPFDAMLLRLAALGVDTNQVALGDGGLMIGDTTSFVKAKLSVDSVARALAEEMRAIPGVNRVDMLIDLAKADTVKDVIAVRWLHMYAPGGTVRFVTTLDRFNYQAGVRYATHGTPWDQDAWVPVIFWGAPFVAGKYDTRARVVDMAPTLADVLGVTPMEKLDGVVLRRAERP
ncbi:MAG: alkaline phosphatase family protein [Gemmatimonadaceae bacterium]|nr:alkaline phosphatase family protein [Gemmatimonadaceae bacterium]